MFTVTCGNCGVSLNAPDTVAGKAVKCKKCGSTFVARKPGPPPPPPPKPLRDKAPPKPVTARRRTDHEDHDDDVRPSRRSGPASDGNGKTMLILGLAAGLALFGLCGGGVGAYFAFFHEPTGVADKTTTARADPAPPFPPRSGVRGGGDQVGIVPKAQEALSSQTRGWVQVSDEVGKYRVKFPSQPARGAPFPVAAGQKQGSPGFSLMGLSEFFVCGHSIVPMDGKSSDEQILDRLVQGERMMGKGPGAVSGRTITYQGFKGREVTMTMPGKSGGMLIRFILAGDRLIVLRTGGDLASAESERVRGFFESLEIE